MNQFAHAELNANFTQFDVPGSGQEFQKEGQCVVNKWYQIWYRTTYYGAVWLKIHEKMADH